MSRTTLIKSGSHIIFNLKGYFNLAKIINLIMESSITGSITIEHHKSKNGHQWREEVYKIFNQYQPKAYCLYEKLQSNSS